MSDLYHDSIYAWPQPVDSYWEANDGAPVRGCDALEGDADCDVAVIGGGYAGLSAALHLAGEEGVEVRVLEAGAPGWGASGRNGGICGIGATKLGPEALVARFGADETRRFFAAGIEAVELVKGIAADEGIDIDARGDGDLCVAHRRNRVAGLRAEAESLRAVTGLAYEAWSRDALAERGFRGPEAHGALYIPVGFGLNPLKYVRGLARAALRRGAKIHGESRVTGWSREGGRHRLVTPRGSLRARRVLVATNGFTRDDLNPALRGRLLPVLSNIVTTRPLTAEEHAAQGWCTDLPVYDSRKLLFYFRMLGDGRFLFGARGGSDASPAGARRMRAWMLRRLGEMFPAWKDVEVSHFWRGLICMSPRLTPHLGRLDGDASVFHSLAYHGSGVAMATWSGRAMAREIAGRANRSPIPAVMSQPLERFPLPGLRLWYLRAAYAGYALRDEYT